MGISFTDIIVNICLNQIAADSAFLEVFGQSRKSLMQAFKWTDGKMVRGDDLLKMLHAEYKSLFQNVKSDLREISQGKKPILSKEEFREVAPLF